MGLLTLSELSGIDQGSILQTWANALATGDPARVTQFYAPDAVLLATLDARPLVGAQAIRGYFEDLVEKNPGVRCSYQRVFRRPGGVLAGLYTFEGLAGPDIPARFTFVVGPEGIRHHHSSELP